MKKRNTIFVIGAILVAMVAMTGCKQDQIATDAIETVAMFVGYEIRNDFVWSQNADGYYQAIMEGQVSLDGAQAAEAYLRSKTHPVIANRMVKIAQRVGFDLDAANNIVGVDKVDIPLLKAAAQGFKMGLLLE